MTAGPTNGTLPEDDAGLIKAALVEQFRKAGSAPFLFIGSGFSRRYLGLEDWGALLRRFTEGLKPYEYYLTSADGDLPTVASLIAADFHDLWWSDARFAASRDRNTTKLKDKTSALRIEICNHLNEIAATGFTTTEYPDEVSALSKLNVDGIITTNWDLFLETLFPDYKVYVGQSELLFSHPQSIAEIYKIHGSSQRPSSLVLTHDDYVAFENRNPYLAAKLITLFVEHPIVFIGYSLADKNVTSLLSAVVSCLGGDNIEKLRDNLIFVQRKAEARSSYSQTLMTIDGVNLPITIVSSDSFMPIYEALDATKRKIPTRILRFCKEQLYELVKSESPETKLQVIDIDSIDNAKEVEFVVGLGLLDTTRVAAGTSNTGYQGLSALDLFKDLVTEGSKLDSSKLVEVTIPQLAHNCMYLPVYKHLRRCGIASGKDCVDKKLGLDRLLGNAPSKYRSNVYTRQFVKTEQGKSAAEIISTNPIEKAAGFLPFLDEGRFDGPAILKFLNANIEMLDSATSSYATYFRKLACFYDYHVNGWK